MRIASLSPAATEILFALGKGREIVCVDQFSDFPEEAKKLPHLRGHTAVDVSELSTYSPELVLTETVVQAKLAASLRAAGLPVIHQDLRTLPQVYESIRAYGALIDADAEAKELVSRMQRAFNDVKKKAAHLPRRPRLYVEEWHRPPMASGNWVPEIVSVAGGTPFPLKPGQARGSKLPRLTLSPPKWNAHSTRFGLWPPLAQGTLLLQTREQAPALQSKGELSREVTLEEVASFDPDLIVLSLCGAGISPSKAIVTERPGWEKLRAHIRVIDDSLLNRPGPRLVEGAQRLYGWMFELTH